jgi:N-acetyl-1-D-myo-inositol-2-amino-2-deoxy-alpha-D-glucopyranoside deacetylase
MDEKRTILVVLAHPDDETFGMGGTLALYVRQGVEVHLICATRGEVGEVPDGMMNGFKTVAELREDELKRAGEILGLTSIHFLDYRDSGMPGSPDNHHPQALAAANIDEVAARVAHYIRLFKPQIVLTFDPIGGYHHPDHIAIQRATEKAFYTAGKSNPSKDGLAPFSPNKLYFHTMPKTLLRMGVFLMRLGGRDPHKFGRNGDIDLVSIAEVSFPKNAVIDYHIVADLRDQAAGCHASQGGEAVISKGLFGKIRAFFGSKDIFMRAFPAPTRHIEHDLFEGI